VVIDAISHCHRPTNLDIEWRIDRREVGGAPRRDQGVKIIVAAEIQWRRFGVIPMKKRRKRKKKQEDRKRQLVCWTETTTQTMVLTNEVIDAPTLNVRIRQIVLDEVEN
jgi:hypothetical protein